MILRLFIYTPVSYFRAGSNNRCRAFVLRDPWSTAEGAINCWLFDSPTTARTRDLRITIGDEIGAVYDVTSCALNACPLTSRRSEEHTSELQSQSNLVCRLLLEQR